MFDGNLTYCFDIAEVIMIKSFVYVGIQMMKIDLLQLELNILNFGHKLVVV
jgi:hypothetical protein